MAGFEERFAPPLRFVDAYDEAHAIASKLAGADNFGPDEYRGGLRVLLQSLDYDPRFTERGRRIAWGEVVSMLAARAHAYQALKSTPGADAAPVRRPLVITGLPRSGTTALHKLLAVDPQFQGLEAWITSAPQPRPPRATWADHPRYRLAVERLAVRYAATPGAKAAHVMVADEVDECCLVLRQSFISYIWTYLWSAASYDAWHQCQDERPAYAYFRRVLQLIGSTAPDRRWLLKNPGHLITLNLVFETFPDAHVVQTHRDPAKAVPSLCSLLMNRHDLMEDRPWSDRARMLMARETAKWSAAVARSESIRHAHSRQILDVVHGDFHRDPMAVVRRIYAFAGATLSPDVEADMRTRIAARPELSHGEHRYDIADYGAMPDQIREAFGDYVERFDLIERKGAA